MKRALIPAIFTISLLCTIALLPEPIPAQEFFIGHPDEVISRPMKMAGLVTSRLQQIDSDSNSSVLYHLEGIALVGKQDRVRFKVEEIKGKSKILDDESLYNHTYTISYFGEPVGKIKYLVNLFKREDIGGGLTFINGYDETHYKLNLYNNRPSFDAYSYIIADIQQSGYSLDVVYRVPDFRQRYRIYYDNSSNGFIENNERSNLDMRSIGFVASQYFLNDPNSLKLSLNFKDREVTRKDSLLFPNQRAISVNAFYLKQLAPNLQTEAQIGIGNELLDQEELAQWELRIIYDPEPFRFILNYRFNKRSLTSGESDVTSMKLSANIGF